MSGRQQNPEIMEDIEEVQNPDEVAAQLQQQIAQQRAELDRLRKEKEDAELAAQLQRAALQQPGPSSGKIEGMKAPDRWNPKQMSWTEFSITLVFFFLNCVKDRSEWGLRALTYLPVSAQQAFVSWIQVPVTSLTSSTVTWEKICEFCEQHQVAHLDTNGVIRETLFRKLRQYDPTTRVTTPLADYLAKIEALFVKCTAKLDAASNGLPPALKPLCQIDPATNKEFLTYEALRNHLVTFLGLSNYFRRFIQGYSKVAWPLNYQLPITRWPCQSRAPVGAAPPTRSQLRLQRHTQVPVQAQTIGCHQPTLNPLLANVCQASPFRLAMR